MINQKKRSTGRQFLVQVSCNCSCGACFPEVSDRDKNKPFRKGSKFSLLSILLALSIFLLPCAGIAADVKVTPKIAVGGAYDDNVLLTTDEKISSSILTISPGFELDYQSLLSNLSLKADWDVLRYSDESDLNRTDHYYRLTGDRRIQERWETAVDFKYYKDTTLNTYLQETGRVINRVERDFLQAGGKVSYDLTQVSGISSAYFYQNATYDDDIYSDYDRHDAALYYFHRLKNERDTLSIGPSYYYRSNDENDVDSFSLDIGWDRDWSSVTRSGASIGARYSNVKRNDGTEDDNWGGKAKFEIRSLGTASTTFFRYFHDLRTTVDGDDVNVDNFYLSYRRSITERFGAGINGRLVFSYKLFDQESDINDERYYWLEPSLFYQLTEHIDLSLRYRYQNNVEVLDEGDQTRERNTIWLQLSYGLPIQM